MTVCPQTHVRICVDTCVHMLMDMCHCWLWVPTVRATTSCLSVEACRRMAWGRAPREACWAEDTHCRALLVLEHDLEPALHGAGRDRGEDDGHFDGAEGADVALCYLHGDGRRAQAPCSTTAPPRPPRGRVPEGSGGRTTKPGPARPCLPGPDPGRGVGRAGRTPPPPHAPPAQHCSPQ